LVAVAVITVSAAAMVAPVAHAEPYDVSCGFRGPNPPLPDARAQVQHVQLEQPWSASLYPNVKVDNAFDYYYVQLIPGAVAWSVGDFCQALRAGLGSS
jgi:hypothetical protein